MKTQEEAGWGQLGRWAGTPALSISWLLLGCPWSPRSSPLSDICNQRPRFQAFLPSSPGPGLFSPRSAWCWR